MHNFKPEYNLNKRVMQKVTPYIDMNDEITY